MAKKASKTENNEFDAVDLIELLSIPENADSYLVELSEPEQDIDLIALGKEQLKEEAEKLAKTKVITPIKPTTPPPAPYPLHPISSSHTPLPSSPLRPTPSKPTNIVTPLTGYDNDSFEQIIKDIHACQLCGLCKTRKNVVPGVGNTKAKLVLIGEAPGADEDIQGKPFVGKAGQHLDKILAAAGFKKEELYICNILKCRPPNNRDPNSEEMKLCTPFLQRQLALIKPKLIGCLGNIACHYIIGPNVPGITRLRGQWFESIFKIPTFAMYHPSYLIRSASRDKGSPNWQMWQDIRALKAKYDSV